MSSPRRLLTGLVFSAGVVGSVASAPPGAADVSGSSDEFNVVLSADEQVSTFSAQALLELDAAATVTGGDIGLNVAADADSAGSFTATLTSESSGEETTVDVVDTESQGALRAGIDAFDGCDDGCTEDLFIRFERIDTELEGDLGLTWSLDGLVSTDVETTGAISFTVD